MSTKITNRQMMSGILIFFLFLYVSSYFLVPAVHGQMESDTGIDAVFVLDISNSMNETDKERISIEVIKMFIDMSEAARTRIGFVAYNDKIVESQALTTIESVRQKTTLKKKMDNLRFSGYTDIGLGLRKGEEILTSGFDHSRKPFMILLSDGDTYLRNTAQGRTVADSEKDVNYAISKAKEQGYPIYTIGLNHDGTVNESHLQSIASQTGGISFITTSADDLPDIFNKIFANHIQSILVPVAAVTATGELQEVTVTIPNTSMQEANIILLSEKPVSESHLYYSSENVHFYKSSKYTLIKILHPQKGDFLLKFRGKSGDLVKVSLLGNYNVQAQMELAADLLKGHPTTISSYLYQSTEEKQLEDRDVYRVLKAELFVTNLDTNEQEQLSMHNLENGFELPYIFRDSGRYQTKVLMTGPDFYRESLVTELEITNLPPKAVGSGELKLTKEAGEARINLNEYFIDPNNDQLSYTILVNNTEELISTKVEDNFLLISPLHSGELTMTITATDPEGATASSQLMLTIHSQWDLYKKIGLAFLGLLITGWIIYLLVKPKPTFSGRLEAYFLNTASGHDIPVKLWPLASFEKNQRITLSELFNSLDVNEHLPEAEKIFLAAGKNQTLVLKHNTQCTISKGATPVRRNRKETLHYNDKVYITFEDQVTEVQLRYKQVKAV